MSYQEVDRLDVIKSLESKHITQLAAAIQLRLSTRQIRRLQTRYQQDGISGLISKHRGKKSSNQLSAELKAEIVKLIQDKYRDYGPTLAHEKLTEVHAKKLSAESVRHIMITEGLWEAKQKRKEKAVFQLRQRREKFGELIQIDGSPHDGFEGRSAPCTLIVFIDDATSKLTALHFSPTETTQAYMEATKDHLRRYGRPVATYSDRHGIFRVNQPEAKTLQQFRAELPKKYLSNIR